MYSSSGNGSASGILGPAIDLSSSSLFNPFAAVAEQ